MKKKFAWNDGVRISVSAEVAGPVLMEFVRIHKEEGRSASELLKAAKDPAHPLHGEFKWDDRIAAQEHRLDRARCLLRSIRVITPERKSVRAIISIKQNSNSYKYYDRAVVLEIKELKDLALEDAIRRIMEVLERYSDIAELDDVRVAIALVSARLQGGVSCKQR